jgi:hypothetical protein
MNQTNLRKILLESLINPKAPGKMKVIVDAGNPDYFVSRAAEGIRAAQSEDLGSFAWHQNIITTITLLGLARLYRQADKKPMSIAPSASAETMFKMKLNPEHFSKVHGYMEHNTIDFKVPVKQWKAVLKAYQKMQSNESAKDN